MPVHKERRDVPNLSLLSSVYFEWAAWRSRKEVKDMWEFNFSSNAEWVVGVLLAVSVVVAVIAIA